MKIHKIRLSSAEISGLWRTYKQESMSICFLKYFIHHCKDEEIKEITNKAINISISHLEQIKKLFTEENFPIPTGFSDDDINLSAPPLFHELFGLSYIYAMNRMGMISYSFITSSVARMDVRTLFTNYLNQAVELYNDATTLMLLKGVYDRPPMINYPQEIAFIKKDSFFSDYLSKNRPINVTELTEIFLNIERNYYGLVLSVGLLQVVKDKEIKAYIKEGKEICEKQIDIFNGVLKQEDLLGKVPVTMEVTESTISPFSYKLIMSHFQTLNSIDITLLGHALSVSQRSDLSAAISKLIGEIIIYAKKGFDIMVGRQWLEKPPQATNRKELYK